MTDLFEAALDQGEAKRGEILAKWKDKTPEEVLNAKVESDLYIETLTKRQEDISKDYLEMKKQLDATASLQELRDQILNAKATSHSDIPNANEGTESHKTEPVDIDKKVRELIEETRRVERQTANANHVQSKLKERFGNNYQQALRDTGLSEKQINEIAGDSPEAIFRLVGLDSTSKESFQAPPRNSQLPSFAPKGQTKRDWSYYQELKKTNPTLYLDRKIAVQMHNDAVEQGEAFYGHS